MSTETPNPYQTSGAAQSGAKGDASNAETDAQKQMRKTIPVFDIIGAVFTALSGIFWFSADPFSFDEYGYMIARFLLSAFWLAVIIGGNLLLLRNKFAGLALVLSGAIARISGTIWLLAPGTTDYYQFFESMSLYNIGYLINFGGFFWNGLLIGWLYKTYKYDWNAQLTPNRKASS